MLNVNLIFQDSNAVKVYSLMTIGHLLHCGHHLKVLWFADKVHSCKSELFDVLMVN